MQSPSLSRLLARFRPARISREPDAPAQDPAPPPPPPSEERVDAQRIGFVDMAASGWMKETTSELAPGFPVRSEDVVVDVGSGDGGMATFCARRAAETILVDADEARLSRTLENLRSKGLDRIRSEPGDAAAVPLPDGVATRVVCTQVLEHVDDPGRVMRELVRIGRPGALYLLSVPAAASERLPLKLAPASYFQKPNHIRIFEPEEFARVVQDAGLVIEGRHSHGFFWTIYLAFFWRSGVELGTGSDPLLDAWTRTWSELMRTAEGWRIKAALDQLTPQCDTIVARKPS